jgi:hypothetical protein
MNTTTNTTHAGRYFAPEGRYFAPGRIFAPEARYFAPEGRYFAPGRIFAPESRISCPQVGLTESMPCAAFSARLAGPAPGPARPGIGWLRRP